MALKQDLFALERQFWNGDAEFYRRNLDDRCLIAFSEMAGVMRNEDVAATIKDGQRWQNLAIEESGFLAVDSDVAILTYKARAQRSTGDVYRALVSSGYVSRDGIWKMAFHQQTPL